MIQESTIRKLVDYVLLNACSVNSSGLYNGKAGLSLALFEVARYLKDEYIEEQAFELLQESLLSKNENIDFENGLSGIGYVLLYLIENKFIDADFDELFIDNHLKIEKGLKELKKQKSTQQLFSYLSVVYYLCFSDKKGINRNTAHFIEYFSKETSKLLIDKLTTIGIANKVYSKMDILKTFELYLKVANSCNFFKPSIELLGRYAELYKQSKFSSNFFIGYYLNNIAKKLNDEELLFIGESNEKMGILNVHPQALSLSEKIDLFNLIEKNKNMYEVQINSLQVSFLKADSEELFEELLLQSINPTNFIAGYQSGIARFLLYYVSKNAKKEDGDLFIF